MPKRKRGRPKGWRPGMPYSATPKLKADADRRKGEPKRRGRPPKARSPSPRKIYEKLRPPYIPFLCEWEGCKAELQNIETLRKHILVVHGWGPLVCKWAKCAAKSPPPSFESEDDFAMHIEEAHLIPFMWHLGEGFRNTPPDRLIEEQKDKKDRLPDYLFDEHGNQVTPSIRDQEMEDQLSYRENRKKLRALLLQRDANAPYEDEDNMGEAV
ncbi:hypothetical protein NKR23_g4443 [Pleurostoma richardsiae]|uniref:C2H2-type domain-containing protein n=1 Tax=Pleurostoma richardsiae TaxID=41990 RepID=A0AA38VSA9_9PEZI|nr:hypothetical protein NKR23_g4443 [Pleurostoma richardsiae]